jgi:beta-lactam-binding protein with PASTA domain
MSKGLVSKAFLVRRIDSTKSVSASSNAIALFAPLKSAALFLSLLFLFAGISSAQVPVQISSPVVYPGAQGTIPVAVGMGDFNADGFTDFAVVEVNPSTNAGQVQIYLSDPSGNFIPVATYTGIGTIPVPPPGGNHIIGVGNFTGPTGNGPSIAVAVSSAPGCPTGGVTILYGLGGGVFQAPTCLPNPTPVTSLVVADYDKNGFDDLAVSNANGAAAGSISIYLNTASTNPGVASSGFTLNNSYSIRASNTSTVLYGTIVGAKTPGDYSGSIAILASAGPFTQYVGLFQSAQTGSATFTFVNTTGVAVTSTGSGYSDLAIVNLPTISAIFAIGGDASLQFSTITPVADSGVPLYVISHIPSLGSFQLASARPIGLALATADFNGNGTPDFAYLDSNDNLGIALDATTTTTSSIGPLGPPGQSLATQFSPALNQWIVVSAGAQSQLNPVTFASYYTSRSIVVYRLNPTSGQPSPAVMSYSSPLEPSAGQPRAFAIGNFKGAAFNGFPVEDVAVLGEDSNIAATVEVFPNDFGTAFPPGYGAPVTSSLGSGGSLGTSLVGIGYAIASGQFRAFDPDIAVVTSQGITLVLNNGSDNFSVSTACAGYFGVAPNSCYLGSDPHFPTLGSNLPYPPSIIVTDLNNDGLPDIAVAFPENCFATPTKSAIYVLLSNGDGTFKAPIYVPSPVVNPSGLAAAKIFGGANPDLVVTNGGEVCSGSEIVTGPPAVLTARVAVIPNNGSGSFGTPQTILGQVSSDPISPVVSSVAVADMNGDGAPDVVLSVSDGIHVLLNNPLALGSFTDRGPVPLYAAPDIFTNVAQISIADLNLDGNLDVAATVSGIVFFLPGDGKGGLSTPTQFFAAGPGSNQIIATDVNQDGIPDVLVNNPTGFSVLLNETPPTAGYTRLGSNIVVNPIDSSTGLPSGVSLTFAAVTQSGVTTVSSSSSGPAIPSGFQLGSVYYNISTTAVFTPPVTVCIPYSGSLNPAPQILHFSASGAPSNITNTTSPAGFICGTTNSFSPFAIVQQTSIPATTTTTTISAPGVASGISATATVSVSATVGTPAGTVTLSVDGGAPLTQTLSSGSASFNLGILSSGPHTLAASYAAQGNFLASTASATLTVTPPPVIVPNVVGLPQSAATTAITGLGLTVASPVSMQTSTSVPAGSVISETPSAGTSVTSGSAVSLVVSSGPPLVAVPNVVGLSQSNATSAITSAGLTVASPVATASSTTTPAGNVISETPVAGTSVPSGTAVSLVVSSGPPLVAVPNVVGLSQSAATTAITAAGLTVALPVATASSTTIPVGNVISETPAAGTSVTSGSAVSLVVSSGPPTAPPPVNISNSVSQTGSGLVYSRVSKTFSGTITVTNTGSTTLSGPFQIVLTGLPSGVTLNNASGTFNGSPFITLAPSTLAPGQSVVISVQFTDPSMTKITFTPVLYSGTL